jgi:hypothetical protein
MATFYLDYELGNDANNGSAFGAGTAWKTLTLGATAAKIAPGDIIKIAKSPAPTALAGTTATWTNLSRTVTLNTAETYLISACETDWSVAGHHGTSALAYAGWQKEGTKAVNVINAAVPLADEIIAFWGTGAITNAIISAYQCISFWIRPEVAVLVGQLEINLCSDNAGATAVDTFAIPALAMAGRWVPLRIVRAGGGNLGNNDGVTNINSINISLGANATKYPASKFIYIDNFNATTTAGLNNCSLISKNNSEQGGDDGWYGIKSINGTTVILDTENMQSSANGKGWSGTTGVANTYKRETIKTVMTAGSDDPVQQIMDSGTAGNTIKIEGGYDTTTGSQTGETYFDGQNGGGKGILSSSRGFVDVNYINITRYNYGIAFESSNNCTIKNVTSASNCSYGGIRFDTCSSCAVTYLGNANNCAQHAIYYYGCQNMYIGTINRCSNNSQNAIYQTQARNSRIDTINNTMNNGQSGINANGGGSIEIKDLLNSASSGACVNNNNATITIENATVSESTKVTNMGSFNNSKTCFNKLNGNYATIFTDGGTINSQASTLVNGSGTEWKLTTDTNTNRSVATYPLILEIARFAMIANKAVTVTCWFKKGHATAIIAKLVFPAQLGEVEHTATCPSDTLENNLTITFTPTVAGVARVEAWAFYYSGHSSVIIDNITMAQAD